MPSDTLIGVYLMRGVLILPKPGFQGLAVCPAGTCESLFLLD